MNGANHLTSSLVTKLQEVGKVILAECSIIGLQPTNTLFLLNGRFLTHKRCVGERLNLLAPFLPLLVCEFLFCCCCHIYLLFNAHLFHDKQVLQMIDLLHQLSCYRRVRLGTELQPLAKHHGHLNDIHHISLLIKFLNDGREFASLSPSPAIAIGSPDSFTCVMSASMVNNSLLTSSGRVTLLAARASFHPSATHHLDMVTREMPTFSAISACSIPDMNSVRANERFFSISALSCAILY